MSDNKQATDKQPYRLNGYYSRIKPETGEREKLGPGDIAMLKPKRARALGAVPIDPRTLQPSASSLDEADGDVNDVGQIESCGATWVRR
jgi:hypothetical protein